jgi:hypothetical protein
MTTKEMSFISKQPEDSDLQKAVITHMLALSGEFDKLKKKKTNHTDG